MTSENFYKKINFCCKMNIKNFKLYLDILYIDSVHTFFPHNKTSENLKKFEA